MQNTFFSSSQLRQCTKHQNITVEYIEIQEEQENVKYYCRLCLQENPELSNILIPIYTLKRQIEDKLPMKRTSIIDALKIIEKNILDLKNNINISLTQLDELLKKLNHLAYSYDIEDELKCCFFRQKNSKKVKSQEKILSLIEEEAENCATKIRNQLDKYKTQILQLQNSNFSIEKKIIKNKNSIYRFAGEQIQQDYACGLGMDNQCNKMVSSCENLIKLWEIEKSSNEETIQLKETIALNYHDSRILCCVYSKNIDWFATSGCDGKIYCFKLNDGQWIASQPGLHHEKSVYSIVLNSKEDRLFSCGYDKKIVIWKIDQSRNTIELDQVLEKCQSLVYSLAINEQYLVSSSLDQYLYLWKNNGQKYEFQDKLFLSNPSYRVTFLERDQFAISYQLKDIISIFAIENQKIIEKKKLEIKLNVRDCDGDYLFPSIYNSRIKILIQKFSKYVFVLKRFNNGMFKIIQIIDCQDNYNYGILSNDGKMLIIWDFKSKNFKIYTIKKNNPLFESFEYISIGQDEQIKQSNDEGI